MTEPLDDPVAAAFLDWCAHERVPANTIRRRRAVLRAIGNPGTATREDLEAWWATRTHLPTGRPRAESSRANELANLRTFYKWCQVWEHRTDDPTIRLRPPRVPGSLPRPATRTQLQTVLEAATNRPDLRRAVALGAYAGLRVSEAAALTWSDINLELHRITVIGKGRKRRVIAISTTLLDELGQPGAGNVVTGTTTTLTADALRRRINRLIASTDAAITFHQLRHRYGTIAYQATGDLVAVRDLMGHASIATTSGYAAANDTVAGRIAEAVTE